MNLKIEGDKIPMKKSPDELFNFFSKPANFAEIMPEDIGKFEAGDDWFIFGLKGMPDVKLKVAELVPGKLIHLVSASDKIPFSLKAEFEPQDEGCTAQLNFEGNFNPMLKMMVERPLKSFLGKLSDKLKVHS